VAQRVLLHIDMNSFFASVEQAANPDLKGKPVVVIGSRQRTVILTASYEARKFGIKTGMMLHEARSLCPDVIMVAADNRKYTHTSIQIMKMMLDYTPLVEVFSIDEAFMDVTHSLALFTSVENIAYLLKARIKHRLYDTTIYNASIILTKVDIPTLPLTDSAIDPFYRGSFVSSGALPQVVVDEALIGYFHFLCQRLEIFQGIFIQTNGHLPLQFSGVRIGL